MNILFALISTPPLPELNKSFWKEFSEGFLSIFSHNDWGTLASLGIYSLCIGAVFTLLLAGALLLFSKKYLTKRQSNLHLRFWFVAIFLYGFVIYDVGMYKGGYISLLTNAPMALIHAFTIFVFSSDVSEIQEEFHASWLYNMNFALVHFLGAAFSMLFLIRLFGFSMLSRLRMWLDSDSVQDTYIFWGLNDATVRLVKSINDHHKSSDSYRVIVVRTITSEEDKSQTQTVMSRIFDFLSMRTSEMEQLVELGCQTDNAGIDLSKLDVPEGKVDIFGEYLKMSSLKRLLKKCDARRIHIFFLSDNEKSNIRNVNILSHDSSLSGSVTFYCHSRYNSVHRVIEDQNSFGTMRVKVIDSSHINVELLKQKETLLPVNFVNVERDATVSSPFNALVIGFSEVGRDSVRFLYEFSAFVKTGSTDGVAERADFHLDVVDKNMRDLAGGFAAGSPAINISEPKEEADDGSALISLYNLDCRSVEFYRLLNLRISSLNYVVIATEDDELNMTVAVRIFQAATRFRADMKNFCILVRVHSDTDGHLRRIAAHYNRLWAANVAAAADGDDLSSQTAIKESDEITLPICIFGLDSEIYTYDNIIADTLERKAREYHAKYSLTMNPDSDQDPDKIWDNDFRLVPCDGPEHCAPTYFRVMKVRRQRAQDFANSLHELTKLLLVKKALIKCGLDGYDFTQLCRKENTLRYIRIDNGKAIPLEPEISRILITIAQTEHLRWNASHEILGYVCDDKDEVRLRHNFLRSWHELDTKTRSLDCNVADVILGVKFFRQSV